MTKHKEEKNVGAKTIALAVLAIVLAYLAVIAILFYGMGANNFLVNKTVEILPFPVAMVGTDKIVTAGELNEDLVSVRRFYESQDFSKIGLRVDFSTEDGQKRLKVKERRLLNKLIENRIIEKLASERGISITKKMAEQNVDRELERYNSNADVKERLFSLYGWDMDDFTEKIVKPDMYREELQKNMQTKDGDYTKAKSRIDQAKEELKNKVDFAEVAKKYSDGESASNGGELGWFSADQVMPEIAIFAFLMKKGEQSDILETPLGFHIIQIDDQKTEDGVDKIKVRQILVKTKSFPDWLSEQEKEISVSIFAKGYFWNKEAGVVEFKDKSLTDFENNLEKNSAGDVSTIF